MTSSSAPRSVRHRLRRWGCAVDAYRCSRRRVPEATWRSDPRMQCLDVDGHRLRVLDTGGRAPPVLLATDAPVVLEHYVALVDRLAAERRVIAFEMPGFGYSFPHESYRFTLDEQAQVVLGLLDGMGLGRSHLAFTCVNGLVAAAVARRAPHRVARLTLGQLPGVEEYRAWARRIDLSIGGLSLLGTPGIGQSIMALGPGWVASKWFNGVSGPAADAAELTAVARRVYRGRGVFCLAALNQALRDVSAEQVGPIDVPTTFLWGAADRSHRRTDRRSSSSIAPDAELHELEGLGHCFDIEAPDVAAGWILRQDGETAP